MSSIELKLLEKQQLYVELQTHLIESMKEKAQASINYLLKHRETIEQKVNVDDLITKISTIPLLMNASLEKGLLTDLLPIHTKEWTSYIFELLNQHDFCDVDTDTFSTPEEIADNIKTKSDKFHGEMFGHIPVVNAQVNHLKAMKDGMIKFFSQEMPKGKGIFNIFDTKTSFPVANELNQKLFSQLTGKHSIVDDPVFQSYVAHHDTGKFGPEKKNGVNNYLEHPSNGARLVKAFLDKGYSIFEADVISDFCQLTGLSVAEVNSMTYGEQMAHLVLAGPALGENSVIATLPIITDPVMKSILADPTKRAYYFQIICMVTVCDIASLGFLSQEKIDYYFNAINWLNDLAEKSAKHIAVNEKGQPLFNKMNANELLLAMMGNNPDAVQDEFWRRFEGVLSANTPNNDPQRHIGYIKEKFMDHLKGRKESKAIQKDLFEFFNGGLYLEYFRNFFQGLLLEKNGDTLQNKTINNFDQAGLDLFMNIIRRLRPDVLEKDQTYQEKKREYIENQNTSRNGYQKMIDSLVNQSRRFYNFVTRNSMPDLFNYNEYFPPIAIRTGSTNSQVDYSNPVKFTKLMTAHPRLLDRLFKEKDANNVPFITVEFDNKYLTWRIHLRYEEFMKKIENEHEVNQAEWAKQQANSVKSTSTVIL